jgi:hypothetical protein
VFLDNRNLETKHSAELTYLVLAGDSSLNGTAVSFVIDSIHGFFTQFNVTQIGIHVLAVYLNSVQIPNTPFLFAVTKRSCLQFQGKVSDLQGNCVCAESATFDLGGVCISVIAVTVASVGGILAMFGIGYCVRRILKTEEDQTRKAVEDLRTKMHLSQCQGIFFKFRRLSRFATPEICSVRSEKLFGSSCSSSPV